MQALRRLRFITLNDSKALLFDSTITSAASPVLMASYLHKTPDISRTFAAYRTYTPSEFKLYSFATVAFCILQREDEVALASADRAQTAGCAPRWHPL